MTVRCPFNTTQVCVSLASFRAMKTRLRLNLTRRDADEARHLAGMRSEHA